MPALQFYPADWRKDPAVQSLDYQSRGIWFEMLCLMHESSERGVLLLNGSPMPDEALARILGLDNQTLKDTLTKILTYGVAKRRESDGAIISKRMVKDENLCKVRRESGKLGGNPALLNQNVTTVVKQVPTPSSSSSSSSSSSKEIYIPKTAKGKKSKKVSLPSDFAISDRVTRWAKEKGYSNLEAHFENFVSACRKSGYQYVDWDEALMDAIRKDWAKVGSGAGGTSIFAGGL